jgi:hypothetical protein
MFPESESLPIHWTSDFAINLIWWEWRYDSTSQWERAKCSCTSHAITYFPSSVSHEISREAKQNESDRQCRRFESDMLSPFIGIISSNFSTWSWNRSRNLLTGIASKSSRISSKTSYSSWLDWSINSCLSLTNRWEWKSEIAEEQGRLNNLWNFWSAQTFHVICRGWAICRVCTVCSMAMAESTWTTSCCWLDHLLWRIFVHRRLDISVNESCHTETSENSGTWFN